MQGNFFSVKGFLLAHFAKYLLGTVTLLIASLTIMSFTNDNNGPEHKSGKDSAAYIKGFRSLFNGGNYDPAKPYLFQLNPKAVSFVESYIDREKDDLEKMREWGKPYFSVFDKILTSYGVPKELKYLAVIESNLSQRLRSWAGAVGPWQLMPDEAKRYGLKKTGREGDERMDFAKSTAVAAQILKSLYNQFGDWLLVIAAYNGGVGRVKQAIRKADSRNFWDLQNYLPEETRNHVKKFIATHYVFEGGGGWTTMTAEETAFQKANIQAMMNSTPKLSEIDLKNTAIVQLKGRYNAEVISKSLLLDMHEFNRLNPGFNKALSEGKTYQLRLPSDKLPVFQAKKQEILQECVEQLLQQQDNGPISRLTVKANA
jgi:membrane-bound lytic murein transglycosylase D